MAERPRFGFRREPEHPKFGFRIERRGFFGQQTEVFGPHPYPRVYEYYVPEDKNGRPRVIVSAPSGHVALIRSLVSTLEGPFRILYVLVVGRGPRPGRYEFLCEFDRDAVDEFLEENSDYFEQDGRHNIWIDSLDEGAKIVYDRHEIIYLYGNQAAFETVLTQHGFTQGKVHVPEPHWHFYKPEFDEFQDRIVNDPDVIWNDLKEPDYG